MDKNIYLQKPFPVTYHTFCFLPVPPRPFYLLRFLSIWYQNDKVRRNECEFIMGLVVATNVDFLVHLFPDWLCSLEHIPFRIFTFVRIFRHNTKAYQFHFPPLLFTTLTTYKIKEFSTYRQRQNLLFALLDFTMWLELQVLWLRARRGLTQSPVVKLQFQWCWRQFSKSNWNWKRKV